MIVPNKRPVPQLEMEPAMLFAAGELLVTGETIDKVSHRIGRDVSSFMIPAMKEYMTQSNTLMPEPGDRRILMVTFDTDHVIEFEFVRFARCAVGSMYLFRSVEGGYVVSFTEHQLIEATVLANRIMRKEHANNGEENKRARVKAVA